MSGTGGEPDRNRPLLSVAIAAQLTGLHPQTLREYDRLGLVRPARTAAGHRLYSLADVDAINRIQSLAATGIGLAGVVRIIELEAELDRVQAQLAEHERRSTSTALVLYRPRTR